MACQQEKNECSLIVSASFCLLLREDFLFGAIWRFLWKKGVYCIREESLVVSFGVRFKEDRGFFGKRLAVINVA